MRMFSHVLVAVVFVTAAVAPSLMLAQSAPLKDNQKAVLVFDLRMDLIRDSELAKSLGVEDQLKALAAQNAEDGPDPSSITRIFGALSAPENMAAAQGFAMGEMPIEFFVKVQLVDASAATTMMEKIKSEGGPSFEKDGKTYYRPPEDGNAPENLVMHQYDETTLEFGTEAYVFHGTQKVFTDGLVSTWKNAPKNQAVRIAFDVAGTSGLLAEAVELGKQGGNPMVIGYLDLVDNMKDLCLAIDISGDNLITLNATAVDSENANELRGGIDALLGLAKAGLEPQIPQAKEMDPQLGAVLESFVNSLNAGGEGDNVSVVIPKPEGFGEAVEKAVEQFGGALQLP